MIDISLAAHLCQRSALDLFDQMFWITNLALIQTIH